MSKLENRILKLLLNTNNNINYCKKITKDINIDELNNILISLKSYSYPKVNEFKKHLLNIINFRNNERDKDLRKKRINKKIKIKLFNIT